MEESEQLKSLVQQGYDKIAQHYMDWSSEHESPRLPQLQKLLAFIPSAPEAVVLELGCGSGIPGTKFLASNFRTVIANDISTAQIDLAKKHLNSNNVQFMSGDMTKLIFESSHFEVVVAFYSIIHLPKQEQIDMFKKVWSWLKPGGYLLCNLGTTEDPGGARTWLGDTQMYWSGFDADQYHQILTERGFCSINTEIITDNEDGKLVPFLWVLAQKPS
jgi:ubiquinone/menaquinone biosynthesis C-methylase UbiE